MKNQSGYAHLVVIFVLVFSIVAGVVITQQKTGFLAFAAPGAKGKPSPKPVFSATPLIDMTSDQRYLNEFRGGLYENGLNSIPLDHDTIGATESAQIQPLDASGNPSPSGKIVMTSIGMSNTSGEFCGINSDCNLNFTQESFMGQSAASTSVNHSNLVIVNGAQGGQDSSRWESPTSVNFDTIVERLAQMGVTEKQVQVIWIKQANAGPNASLPSTSADAYVLEQRLANIVRAAKVRYPNLKQVFVSSRIYAGYATGTLNPEPYAYETGFGVKMLIQAQIDQMRNSGTVVDVRAGDLNYQTGVAPWIAWGPYLWASDSNPRSDGLTWLKTDYNRDMIHPNDSGIQKVGSQLLNFFLNSPHTKCYFTAAGCP